MREWDKVIILWSMKRKVWVIYEQNPVMVLLERLRIVAALHQWTLLLADNYYSLYQRRVSPDPKWIRVELSLRNILGKFVSVRLIKSKGTSFRAGHLIEVHCLIIWPIKCRPMVQLSDLFSFIIYYSMNNYFWSLSMFAIISQWYRVTKSVHNWR